MIADHRCVFGKPEVGQRPACRRCRVRVRLDGRQQEITSHGGSHRFESCSAHQPNQSLAEHLRVLRCSRTLQLLRYVPQIIV